LAAKLLIIGKHLQISYSEKVKGWLRKYNAKDVIIWLNFVPYEEVPHYIATMDVATIPFDIGNPMAYYAMPNKLWEYLSQGTLVAATPLPEVLAYRQIRKLFIVKTPEDYVKAFEEAGKNTEKNIDPYVQQTLKTRLWSHSAEKLETKFKSLVN